MDVVSGVLTCLEISRGLARFKIQGEVTSPKGQNREKWQLFGEKWYFCIQWSSLAQNFGSCHFCTVASQVFILHVFCGKLKEKYFRSAFNQLFTCLIPLIKPCQLSLIRNNPYLTLWGTTFTNTNTHSLQCSFLLLMYLTEFK